MKKYEISYMKPNGERDINGMIEEEGSNAFLVSKCSPHRKRFYTFDEALASFELVEAKREGLITDFEVKAIA